jgi:soluble lytic murein transglycosylase-like protein
MSYAHYRHLILAAESRYGLPHGLLAGVLDEESGIRNVGCNTSGACGIAQIVPADHGLTEAQALDPAVAIPAAASILADNLRQCGSVPGALKRYFSGRCNPPETATDANGTTPGGYVSAVLARAMRYGYGQGIQGRQAPPASSAAVASASGGPVSPPPAGATGALPFVAAGVVAAILAGLGVQELERGI